MLLAFFEFLLSSSNVLKVTVLLKNCAEKETIIVVKSSENQIYVMQIIESETTFVTPTTETSVFCLKFHNAELFTEIRVVQKSQIKIYKKSRYKKIYDFQSPDLTRFRLLLFTHCQNLLSKQESRKNVAQRKKKRSKI
ncbi:hypothetical protein BpHYR1_040645 [Brachionus plicatilis]|uniref:Uncharacterized protein n=1 Tax=Brachionus plicatilis TaxID=10195 RepID=A0A3M7QGP4_BRAPC|nr:hypothetical protein BpHYR1_040645 [Brachionus plicatilis]